jgi:hypothetical protein
MHNTKLIKALLAASAAAMIGALPAHAQTATNPKATVMPPVTGEPNDPTSPNVLRQPEAKARPKTPSMKPGVNPPVTGEANDYAAPAAMDQPPPKTKAKKSKAKKATVKPPVTGEANEPSSPAGTTEAAKPARDAKSPGM